MSKIFHPLLIMLAGCTEKELARQVQYLKEENQILRAKLPKRITVTAGGTAEPSEDRQAASCAKTLESLPGNDKPSESNPE